MLGEGYRTVLQGLALGLVFGTLVRLLLRATVNGNIAILDPLAFALVPVPRMPFDTFRFENAQMWRPRFPDFQICRVVQF